jgi:LacI family transcriptional regulator
MSEGRITLHDVAKLAGVHAATASRALNVKTRSLVKGDTVIRVLAAAEELDYRPNPVARGLKTRRTLSVGVVIPDLNNPLFPPIVRGIEDRLAKDGYVALLGNTDNDDERERRIFEEMRGRHVDGLVVATARRDHPVLVQTARTGTPIVLVNRVVDDHTFSSLSADDGMGIRHVLAHLSGLGHRRIAHVAGPQTLSTGFGRYRGYLAGMEAAGLDVDDRLVAFAQSFSEEEGHRRALEVLGSNAGCTAIVAGNDLLALGCYSALEELGLTCPADISVVGFNDMPFVDRLHPPLTTVRIPHYAMGAQAAELVLERIFLSDVPLKSIFLPTELIVRGSTAPPGGGLPLDAHDRVAPVGVGD